MKKEWVKNVLFLLLVFSMVLSMVAPAQAAGEEESEENVFPSVSISNAAVSVGQAITAVASNYPEGSVLSYSWTVGGKEVGTNSDSYTPTEDDQEKWIQVAVGCEGCEEQTAGIYFSKLPVMYLNFDLDAVITDKSTYVEGTMKLQGNQNYTSSKQLYDGTLQVKGRGNSSWQASKKPFKLKLDSKTDILGMGKNKHWVLLANATEGSLMRNELSYKLSGLWGLTYQDGTWVDLVINGEYYGNYYLCEHIRVGSTRVDIADLADNAAGAADAITAAEAITDNAGNPVDAGDLANAMEEDLSWISSDSFTFNGKTVKVSDYYVYDKEMLISGGYLFELDGYYDEVSKFKSSLNQPIMFNTPEFANTNQDMIDYAEKFINSFEAAIQSMDFHTTYKGKVVSAYDLFDFETLVKYWMVQEVFMNADGMKKSTYFYKNQDSEDSVGKMYMGPVWDMDWSSNGEGGSDYAVWQTVKYTDGAQANQWYKYLCKDPYFLTAARGFYWEHRGEIKDMIASIYKQVNADVFMDNAYDYLYASAMANQELWGKYKKGYIGEVDKLYTWLNNRMDWLDEHMGSVDIMINSMNLYTINEGIRLSYANDELIVTAQGEKAEILVNGRIVGNIDLTNGIGKIDLNATLTEGRDVIYVVVYDKDGNSIGSNYCFDQEEEKGEILELQIVSKPRNTVYTVGSNLDLTGLQVRVIYENGSSETIQNSELTVDGFDGSTIGNQIVTVRYGEFSDSFETVVVDNDQKAGNWENDYITVYSDADTSGEKYMRLEIWQSGANKLYESTQSIAYSGNFTDLKFSFITELGWKVVSVKYRDANGDQNSYKREINSTSGRFTFSGCPVTDKDDGNVLIIDILPIDESYEDDVVEFTLSCSKPTIKVNTNAVVYLNCDKEITADQITVSEDGKPVDLSYAPACTTNEDGTYSWKLYIKPTTLGIHIYTISTGKIEHDIKIKAAKTIFSR